jgi:hypothetical protein
VLGGQPPEAARPLTTVLNGANARHPKKKSLGAMAKAKWKLPSTLSQEAAPRQCSIRASACEACNRPLPTMPRGDRRRSRLRPRLDPRLPCQRPRQIRHPCRCSPLRLTDDQLTAVLRAAEPLAVGDRSAFLQDVAAALQGQELGDGAVYRTVAQVQRRYYDPPILTAAPRWGR